MIHHEYNDLGLLVRQFPEGTALEEAIDDHYSNDAHRNILSVEDKIRGLLTKRAFNDHSELICETLGHGHTVDFLYDALGRCIETAIGDKIIRYTYDAAHLRSVSYKEYTTLTTLMIFQEG